MLDNISARDIAVSGLRAQRTRMNIIAQNIANAETTRTPEGGPFRRQLAVFIGEQLKRGSSPDKLGVRVDRIKADPSPFRTVFDPGHPDADADGYVRYPNINMAVEMVDLISAQRGYEANVAVLVAGSRMQQSAMELLQR
ncbi:MAG: flagellar basal body rod protein FlgC [Candidatus Hydrogenedentes bacterium]|nr:flagellar basal body rod protein FlgC [Candidatus Hydrogenedentota bacterium]